MPKLGVGARIGSLILFSDRACVVGSFENIPRSHLTSDRTAARLERLIDASERRAGSRSPCQLPNVRALRQLRYGSGPAGEIPVLLDVTV
jgi:hypothetical protein